MECIFFRNKDFEIGFEVNRKSEALGIVLYLWEEHIKMIFQLSQLFEEAFVK
jgi:hypothetical protein